MRSIGWSLVAVLAACGGDAYEPKFSAVCAPKSTNDGVTCTVQNLGKKPGRACLTVRLNVEAPMPIMARRVCTAVLQPEQTATVEPIFMRPLEPCSKTGSWACKIDILENSRSLGENQPPER